MNDLETRITEALAARADLVRPESLRDEPLPASVVPLWRRPSVVLAIAACLALLATSAAVLASREQDRPQPAEPTPSIDIPPDVGRGWDRAKASPPAELDLDGDGTDETVRFLAEPSENLDGRVRLQTTLSSDGTSAYGVVDLTTTIGLAALEPVDADRDGDEELVLFHEDTDASSGIGFAGPPLAEPVVLDLRDGVLVRAPATEPERLQRGSVVVAGSSTGGVDLVHVQDFWIEDGTLLASRSVHTFSAFGMTILRPEEYRVDVVEWRLGEDGVLTQVAAETPCLMVAPEARRPCAGDEQDSLPPLGPFAPERIGSGETAQVRDGYRFDVSIDDSESGDGEADLVVNGEDGREVRSPIGKGIDTLALTTVPAIMWDGASVVVASEDTDQPADLRVFVQDRDEMVLLDEVGEVSLASGETADGRTFRSWVTGNGDLYTALATSTDEDEPWQVYTWALIEVDRLTAVPIERMCFDDIGDPATGRRC